jgi:hypothetical protein
VFAASGAAALVAAGCALTLAPRPALNGPG